MKLNDLSIGAKVKDPNSKYGGNPIVWYITGKNHVGYPTNSVTLLTATYLGPKAFDKVHYMNFYDYSSSTIRAWLNRDAYDSNYSENGFMMNLSAVFKNNLLSTVLPVTGMIAVTDKIFLISYTEAKISHSYTEGSAFALFNINPSLAGCGNYALTRSHNYIDPGNITPSITRQFNGSGEPSTVVRPACNLSADTPVSSYQDTEGAYIIGITGPNIKPKIDGSVKNYADGWVKIDGVLRKIVSMQTKIDGVLKNC